tara:strand:+ start:232 stop:1452 length:1221 start_codon:yes stop_codon:yes gene_type:complete
MENAMKTIRDVLFLYESKNPGNINKVYSYCSRENIFNLVTWIGELKDFNSNDCEEFLKNKYMKEAQEKIKKEIDYNNKAYKREIEFIKEGHKKELELCKEHNDVLKEMAIPQYNNSKSNSKIGKEGETVVEDALLKNDKYDDINVKNVTKNRGCGDLIVVSNRYNLNIMVEVKNHKQQVPEEHVNTFIAHYTNYFQDNSDSHAIMFSINSRSISGKGSYKRETIVINNRKHHILYISLVDMTKEFIIEHFNIFTQQIIEENSILTENSVSNRIIEDIGSIKNNTDYLYDMVDSFNYSKQRVYSEIRYYDERIKNTEKLIQSNINFMEARNYIYRKDVNDIVYNVLKIMKDDGIKMDTCNSFKQSFKKIYSSITNFSNSNSSHCVANFLNTYKSYESMYNILNAINI